MYSVCRQQDAGGGQVFLCKVGVCGRGSFLDLLCFIHLLASKWKMAQCYQGLSPTR